MIKVSDYVIDFLKNEGISCVFEVCGGAIIHLLDSLYERNDIIPISMHHEQAAAFAAEGYSRISGNLGVAMATSGPGATNLITGIASCYFDSIPCLFITGQVNTYEFKGEQQVRQIGFQETDIVSIIKPIVKEAMLINSEKKIKYYLEKAVHTAKSGRPGPVLLDIPMNIQRANINPDTLDSFYEKNIKTPLKISDEMVKQVIDTINSSIRPIVLIGGGIRLSKAQNELLEFIHNTGIPVVTSLMGLDGFPHDDELFVGMIGTYGNRYANLALANSDLIIALGTRFDTRQTGTNPEIFAREAKIIHIDIDKNELNNKVNADIAINFDIRKFLNILNQSEINNENKNIGQWIQKIKTYKRKYPSYKNSADIILPNYFIHRLSEAMPEDAIICADVGQNQVWAAQSLRIKKNQRFLTQGGMGAMGSALAIAIGASFKKRGKIIVVITGDGGLQLNIQEFQTLKHYNLPIKVILLNNQCYGMIRQFQEQYFNSRFQSSIIGYSNPNFQNIVAAYKIKVNKISDTDEIKRALEILFSDMNPSFLEVSIALNSKALPKLSVNMPIEDMCPFLDRDEFKKNMIVKPIEE